MAGSAMSFTYDDGQDRVGTHCNVKKVLIDWTSDDTTGAVSGTTDKIVGTLIKGVTDPGSAAPTANYDIAITDEEGVDVLASSLSTLANRHTSTTECVYFNLTDAGVAPLPIGAYPVVCDKLTVAVTNAGNSKTGQIILYYKPL